jgi:hypothetical protein
MTSPNLPELAELADRQFGLVSRQQMKDLGFGADQITQAVAQGLWQKVLRDVYWTEPGESLDAVQQRTAAGLYTAGHGYLSGIAALDWHAIPDLPNYHTLLMLIPHQSRRGSCQFVTTQRTRRLDPHAKHVGTHHVCSVARATTDACRTTTDHRAVYNLMSLVVGRSWTTALELRRELEAAGSSRTRAMRLVLREFLDN